MNNDPMVAEHVSAEVVKASLVTLHWKEGSQHTVAYGPYRYEVIVHCSSAGRQKAEFANGEHSYFSYVRLVDGKGKWIKQGAAGIVPVLPDGRFLTVIEQRPAQEGCYENNRMMMVAGQLVNLRDFGPYSSLEFPGGAVDPGEGLKAGFLRELVEETSVERQHAMFIRRQPPLYLQGADLALQAFTAIVELSGLSYEKKTDNDGGLHIFALTHDDMIYNIRCGVMVAAQAGLLAWSFYKEVAEARRDGTFDELVKSGYVTSEVVNICR